MPNVRPAVVSDVHEIGHDLAGDCREHIVGLEDRQCQLRRFFPTIGTCPTEAPGKDRTPRGVVRSDRESLPCHLDPIPEPPELVEERRMEPPGKTVVWMRLAEIPCDGVRPHGVARLTMSKRECAERMHIPLPSVLVLSLPNSLALSVTCLEATKEIRSLLALEFREPSHGFCWIARQPKPLCQANSPMVPSVLCTFEQRGRMHHLGEVRGGLVMRPQPLAFTSAIEVHRGDRERVNLPAQENRPHPADDLYSLKRLGTAHRNLMDLVPDAGPLARYRDESALQLLVADNRHRNRRTSDVFRGFDAPDPGPETPDFQHNLRQPGCTPPQTIPNGLFFQIFRSIPCLQETHRSRDVVCSTVPCGINNASPGFRGWVDSRLECTLR